MRCKAIASVWLAVGFSTSLIFPAAHASLIIDGSFESPVVPVGGSGSVSTPWTFPNPFAGGGIMVHPPVPGPQGPLYPSVAQHGQQYEDLNSGGVIAQAFSVGAGAAGAYQLTWYDNALIRDPLDQRYNTRYNVYVMAGPIPTVAQIVANYVQPIVASAVFNNFHGDATQWNARSLSMTLATGDYFLLFSNANSGGTKPFGAGSAGIEDNEYMLDNVSLDAVAVPEPTTIIAGALLLLPFGVSTLRALRKQRNP